MKMIGLDAVAALSDMPDDAWCGVWPTTNGIRVGIEWKPSLLERDLLTMLMAPAPAIPY